MSTTVVNSPRYLSQHHRAPHSPHSSPPSSTRSPPRSLSSLSSFNSAGPPPPPPAFKAPPAPSEKLPLAPPPTVLPQECYQQGYPLSPEEARRRRKQVEDAEGWSVLASQHHKSEYNRLKWGDKGSRLYYVPLSIQLPSHVHELMSKQAIFETYCANQQQAQATNQPPSTIELARPAGQDGAEEEHAQGGRMTPPRDLEQEEGLEGTLVSDELEVEGGRDQETTTANDGTSTTTMELQVKDQIIQAMQDQLVVPSSSSSIFPTPPSSQPSPTPTHQNLTSNGQQPASAPPSVARPAAPAVFSSIEAGRGEYARQAQQQNEMGGMMEQQQHHVVVAQPVKTSDSHPINISILIPPSYIPHLSPLLSIALPPSPPPPGFEASPAYLPQPTTNTTLSTTTAIPSSPISPKTTSSATFEQTSTVMQPFRLPPLLDLYLLSLSAPSVDSAPDLSLLTTNENGERRASNGGNGKVGNFLLSSCPGKKVRLTGPVKGRGAICRDLKVDLERIRGLGVGCVVCCLDDEELNYLGAPFEEYAKNAKLVGLDVIRIPMPEGLTPTSLPAFDSQITHIIRTYTLRGIDVLSHCRGGVGRASIVAGSWAIKMGLIIPPAPPSRFANPTFFNGGRGGGEREKEEWARRVGEMEDYATVERVIAVLRRRRSLKAIETYEQVRWLMEYVGWLREEGRVLELPKPRNEA